ncbi:LEA type 2 family protein [Saccharospirillum alexandrii]|uniref:NDR1/HIN1-like protein n=1 Tax=Saccharospirillum alexandrii TaxID=2448477 RepID=UPI000FDB8A17|nr:LEA type 2 family protein [Saccharospirillum alexandrii]
MRQQWLSLGGLVATAFILSGCAGFGVDDAYRQPSFDHQSTRLTGITWTGVNGSSQVKLTNPNAYRLPITEFAAQLWLDGEPWIDLGTPTLNGLAARSSTTLEFDWTVTAAGLLQRARDAYAAGEANLELKLQPTLSVPVLGARQLDWSHDFTVPVPKSPQVSLADWRVEDIGFTSLTLALDLVVTNPNRFGLATGPFDVGIEADGRSLSRMSLSEMDIGAGVTQRQTTEVSLGFGGLGVSLLEALRSGEWPSNLGMNWSGTMRSPDLGLDLPSLTGSISQ